MEEKALLENELEQTRGQKEVEQRLRDELRGQSCLLHPYRTKNAINFCFGIGFFSFVLSVFYW
jgi:hypothetical protein